MMKPRIFDLPHEAGLPDGGCACIACIMTHRRQSRVSTMADNIRYIKTTVFIGRAPPASPSAYIMKTCTNRMLHYLWALYNSVVPSDPTD